MEFKEIKSIRHYKHYDVKHVVVDGSQYGHSDMEFKYAFTKDGKWIGHSKEAYRYVHRFGIEDFDYCEDGDNICSIGFSPKQQKWYGWSHRAIHGFGIGHMVEEGNCESQSGWVDEYLEEHPEDDLSIPVGFVTKTLEDCKRVAIAFAESVG